ncbi:MAG: hypothetical protein A2063_02430 [Gallionellales bacterium GWA2_60_142]|nr:MAG: hypothetical protein A2063_02430 [Gallionellales bacterium GWA2_60_142]HCI13461.1 hypothetical protein [Gallionellaceae bacterium]
MLPANIVAALQTLANSAKPSPNVLNDLVQGAALKLEPGQQLKATVESKLADGFFKVQVAGQAMQMHLPTSVRSGDTIMLQVVATQPKLTFSMAASTTPLSTPDQIGSTARLLSNLAGLPTEKAVIHQTGDKAIWAATQQAPDVKQMASGLREALGKSGLFYESHQAQWIRGERSISQLMEEPQNLLTGRSLPLSAGNISQSIQDKLPVSQAQVTATPLKADSDASLPIAKEVLPLVQQQLHTLENHHMVWMGQVWTGQQMQWQIQGEPKRQGGQENERQWSTEMELSLPRLGDVRATLSFTGQGVSLTLHAEDAKTTELFNRALPQLRDALGNAGVPLQTAKVVKRS